MTLIDIIPKDFILPEGFKICNTCMYDKIKPLSSFDEGRKCCRRCLARRREKVECPCGGRYTRGDISHHKASKRHQAYELSILE